MQLHEKALLFDQTVCNWEIIYDIALETPPDAAPNWEYSSLRMIDHFQLPTPTSPCSIALIEVAQRVIRA